MTMTSLALMTCLLAARVQDEPPVIHVADDDPKMVAAIEKARKTVDTFITALKAPKPGQLGLSIKMAFVEGDQTEHIWLSKIAYDGKQFTGIINNTPQLVKNIKFGQKVTVPPNQISDWMFIESNKLVGGYTIRALRDGMTPAQRKEFDENVPFTMD